MFNNSKNRQKVVGTMLAIFIVVNVFSFVLFLPAPAHAQWVVTDPITGANTTIRNITDFIRVVLIGVMGTALLNGVQYFSQKIAYDLAVGIASGGKGQQPLLFTKNFGEYFEDAALDSVGEVIGSINLPGFDLCRPSANLGAIAAVQLGIAQRFQPPTPRCAWNDLSSNWESFVSSSNTDEVLSGLSNIFQPGQSGIDVAFTLFSRSHEFSLRREMEAAADRQEGGGFRPVTDIISGQITTPADAIRQKAQQLGMTDEKARDSTLDQAGSALAAGAFQLLPATLSIFANTLLSSLTKNIFSGLFSPTPREERGPLFNPEASTKAVSGRTRAQEVFADLLTPKFVEVQNYDALTEFMTCPGKNRGPNNCAIDTAFSSVVRVSESGVPVTISDAIKQGALHPDWVLVPSTDSGNNQDPTCYTRAYCYSNLAKLRRSRIISIGWELAAEQGARLGVKPTLQEVVNRFYDCDPETGGISDAHPWCHLIDPNWVLKYPPTQCKALVKGPTLLAAESSVRTDTCVDAASCVATDSKGECISYGYCTRENNVWRMPGESCPAKYESCESYRKIGAGNKPEKETYLLTNTADFDGCTAEVAGCSLYSNARTPGGAPESGWQLTSRTYFNRNVETCAASDDGCTDLILKGAGVSQNLIRNSSFEVGDPAAGTVTFWNVAGVGEYSVDGTQSYRGNAAIRLGVGAIRQDQNTPLSPETTYVISLHAKQAGAGGSVRINAQLSLRNGAGNLVDLTGRTDCSFVVRNGVLDGRSPLLNFVPRDSYTRSSCTFTTPTGSGFNLSTLMIYGDTADALWVDAVQLEEGVTATEYRENGYPTGAEHASYKIPPAYLGCSGASDDPEECKNYTPVCAREDANCELYTPSDGSPAIPGIATSDKVCPAECVGYSTFRQEPTRFEGSEYPLFFIPNTADKCEAQYAGCDEFTNLETSAVEHYTYLRRCVKPGADTSVYYTWEGSDTTGFQLKVWNLLSGAPQAGEAGRPPAYRVGFTDYAACTRDIFQAGFDPDCREFYDEAGNISYRLYPETVVATEDCNRYRRTEASSGEQECRQYGGEWDAGLSSCTFRGYPKESYACPAEQNLCRAYTGNAGRNFRIIKSARFEDGGTDGMEGLLSSESVFVGGHSLQVLQNGAQNGGSTRFDVGAGDSIVRPGGTYILTFIARGTGRPIIRFSGDEGNMAKYFANAGFELKSDWQKYTVGPVLIERNVAGTEYLNITNLGNPTFIDDVELREVSENIYLIKDSWNTPASCDMAPDGVTPFPQAMLGCAEYKDTRNTTVDLTGFDRLCRDNAVGCRAVIDTKNSTSLEEERYKLACELPDGNDVDNLPDACADASCPCSATVQSEVRVVCQVGRSETSCRFNSIGAAAGAAVGGVNYSVEVRPDSVVVPADETKYLVLSSDKACRPDAAGCTLYGAPTEGICGLGNTCQALGGCNCLINNDVVCKVGNSADTCTYKIPRYYLNGAGANYSNVVLKNNPAKYDSTLCTGEFLGCTEWQKGTQGTAYFKDPADQTCEYRENVTLRGTTVNGWFKKGMDAEPCDPAFAIGGTEYNIRKNGDAQYLGWAGMCKREYAGCTAFLDPADKSSSYPEGKPYYIIKDDRINEGNDCNGRVSQKEGCVLFKDTSVSMNQYSSEATYAVSAGQNYGMVPVSTCPNGTGCKRCEHTFSYNCGGNISCGAAVFGAACVSNEECEKDQVAPPRVPRIQNGVTVGYYVVNPTPDRKTCESQPAGGWELAAWRAVENDANFILKVDRDRSCSEWLDCKTSVTVWDDGLKKFKKVCTQLGRCDSYITTADGIKCANYKTADYSGNILTLDNYVSRDVSWYGEEYSGYSIPSRYPVEELRTIDYDKTAEVDIRLAYVACEFAPGEERNCNTGENAPAGSCRRVGSPCGARNALGNQGRCVTSGKAGAIPLCVYGIDGATVPTQSDNARRVEQAQIQNRSLPREACRAYPEQDSPFPSVVSEWTQNGLPLGRIAGYQQANVCEKFAWRDINGNGLRDTTPAWPDPRAELIPQDCECNYSKAIYNGKSFTKYFSLEGDVIPEGVCQGGPRSGEYCLPGAAYNKDKEAKDPENLKACGPQDQGGFCQKIERIDKVIGQFGQCLEQDLSLSLNGVQNNYACLTWNPLDIVPGGKDIYNQFSAAGYEPSGNTGKYFCLESQGNMVEAGSSPETTYSHVFNSIVPMQHRNNGYEERFETVESFVTAVGEARTGAGRKLQDSYMNDLAAMHLTSNDFGDNPTDEWKKAVADSVGNQTNILSRIGKTGILPSGREYWEVDFNFISGQRPSMLFVDEGLIEDAVIRGGEANLANPSCDNAMPGGQYGAVRAVFDNTGSKKLLGFWIASCDGNANLGLETNFDLAVDFAEPCITIAKVEGSNAAFTDRTWAASGYIVSDEADIVVAQPTNFGNGVPNIPGSPFGAPPIDYYEESFMLGYGYENRNTPFGSAATTLEPFGIDAWQLTGPDGFGSPFTKYIPFAPDAGSPYGQSRESGYLGSVMRCAGSPYTPGSALISLNEGQLCQARTGCPLQKVCSTNDDMACIQDSDCAGGGVCGSKRCGRLDADGFTVLEGFLGTICTSDAQCADGRTCIDLFAYVDCTRQTRAFGVGVMPRGGAGSVDIRTTRQTPLEFLFAKSFGIWKWSATPGTYTTGACVGSTPLAGEVCSVDGDCRNNTGACQAVSICNQGPQKGMSCNSINNNNCNGGIPLNGTRSVCPQPVDEFAARVCPSDSDHPNIACDADSDCYDDNAICNLNAQVPVCTGGVFEDSAITDVGICPPGWIKENNRRCRLPCGSNTECLWSGARCGAVGRCDENSGALSGASCTVGNPSTCQYTGSCTATTVAQPAGYQKLQPTAQNPAPVGWDNRETATLGEQPVPPIIASPDISSCDPQSQKCRVSGIMPGLANINCTTARDCPTGWSCAVRSGVTAFGGVNGDTRSGSTCMPPQTLDLNAISVNNRTSGDLRGAGSYRAVLRFYAWADHNAMPIVSRSINWGDGIVESTVDSRYKNHKPVCSQSSTDDSAVRECNGMPGLTCSKQSDCPVGTGLCSTVGRCTSSRLRCSVSEDCPLSVSGVEHCSLSRFGNSPDACNEEYFEFEHTYACTREMLDDLPACTGSELNPQNRNPGFAACRRDLNGDGRSDACLFRPKVQVKDNWGFCNGICPSNSANDASPGGVRCFENECEVHPGAWTGFGGFITIAPRN